MTIQLAYQQLLTQLYEVYETREAANIADMVIEHVTGQRKIDRILYKDIPVSQDQQVQIEKITSELLQDRPIQYVLGEAWFMEMRLRVNENVLIPRPETEELVEWILTDIKKTGNKEISLFDIGTGSGCIPIAVRKKIPEVAVSAIDVSGDALQVAILNSIEQKVLVDFLHLDFLNEEEWNQLGKYNIIVSNPPYVKQSEQNSMRNNVLKFEPTIALFVPNEDALLFYKAIVKFAKAHLKTEGSVYVEINEALGKDVVNLFKGSGFTEVILKKDMQGKDRMVKATGP
ncbi:peptide chain release factor N(5)-glutamine methyltransferase [Segetibacter aerophilus]|uniref:peptide chain release factor N(5)-glutamine methyltransferase n=1 Tax=Segetibacter aerophilus TaxID=670293 RepID=A0A512B9I3_9BACT|nr:peptide chain release factor N(5)-glutamine methyltransferase [Segetibacter aerophilus]GEO08621.1 release factor glutamine methyltransferase [Segetibacter aerophilus]